jgi:hypothetical protein
MSLHVKSRPGVLRNISREAMDLLGGREDPSSEESGSNANRTDIFPCRPIAQINSNGVWSSDRKDDGADFSNSEGEGPNSGARLSLKNSIYCRRISVEYDARVKR